MWNTLQETSFLSNHNLQCTYMYHVYLTMYLYDHRNNTISPQIYYNHKKMLASTEQYCSYLTKLKLTIDKVKQKKYKSLTCIKALFAYTKWEQT